MPMKPLAGVLLALACVLGIAATERPSSVLGGPTRLMLTTPTFWRAIQARAATMRSAEPPTGLSQ